VPPRRKILVVAGNLSHLDQFVIHGFFKELSEEAEVYLTLPEQDLETDRWREVSRCLGDSVREVVGFGYSSRSKVTGYQIGAALTYRYRKTSESYHVRILESFFGGFELPMQIRSRRAFSILVKRRAELARRIVHEFPAMIRGTRIFFWIWSKFATRRVEAGCSLSSVLEKCDPDVTVTLMQRQAGFVIASIDAGRKLGIPTLLIPYKWDNASSKSPLIKTPNRMLVYNTAIQDVCARMHKMSASTVVAVGSVEIGTGKETRIDQASALVPLIGATLDTRSSANWLLALDKFFGSHAQQIVQENVKLVWRPYPTADENNLEFMRSFAMAHPRFELDKDIEASVSHRSSKITFAQTRAAYDRYISMLETSNFIVSEGTSVIVDARARGLAVIYPAFRNNAVVGCQWHRLNTSNHLKGLRETTGVFIAEDEVEFERLLNDFLTNPRRVPPDNTGEHIFVDHRSYVRRVLDVVEDVLSER